MIGTCKEVTDQNEHKFKVAQDVLNYCGKCKMRVAHVITAKVGEKIARVKCKICGSDHNFRRTVSRSAPGRTKSTKPKKPSALSIHRLWEEKTSGIDMSDVNSYSPKKSYKVDDLISHPTFELGVVTEVMGGHKMRVAFKDSEKILIHER
jgi:hypothetical protein